MAMKVRRIVTGHNAAGQAVIKTDEQIASVPRIGAGISGAEIWSTDQMPIDNSSATDAAQRAGFVKHSNYVGDGGGTTFRIHEWAPAMRDSRTEPKPWTTRSYCQVKLTSNSIVARSSI